MTRLLAVLLFSLFSKTSYGQYVQVSTNVLGLSASIPNLQVEGPWTDKLAVEAGLGMILPTTRDRYDFEEVSGYRVRLTGRYFPGRGTSLCEGFYLGPYLEHSMVRSSKAVRRDRTRDNFTQRNTMIGATIGYSFVTEGGLYLSAGGGVGHILSSKTRYDYRAPRPPRTATSHWNFGGPEGLDRLHVFLQVSAGWRFRRS